MEKPQILIVDDEEVMRKGCEQVLLKMGFSVDSATNGLLGYKRVLEKSYDLVLVDLMMPEMDGLEFLKKVREIDPNLVSVVITGHATIESAVEAVKSGAYDYLPKPFTPNDLRTVITRGLERRRLLLETEKLRRERDQNLLEITNERSRIRTIINCIGEGLIATNCKGQLVLINPMATKMLRLKSAVTIGSPIQGNLNNSELETLFQSTLESLSPETGIQTKQILFNEENSIIYQCTLAPIQEESGEVLGLVVLLHDISEEKKIEKMKSEFVRMVAHELKAPLGAIEGYLNLILDGPEVEPERQKDFIDKSCKKAQALQQLIRDLLDYSSLEAGSVTKNLESLDVREVLLDVLDLMKIEAEKKSVAIIQNFPPVIPPIRGDRNDLNRLFVNLISNAIKYNVGNGKVIIQITVEEMFLNIAIHDTGIGIGEKEQAQIFHEFYRVKNATTREIAGTGLGLSIAKKIAESHFGYISIASEIGKGSTFSVYLPLLTSGIGKNREAVKN
jgi:signal transduction histidine kinase